MAEKKLDAPPSKEVMFDYLKTMYNNVSGPGSFQGVNKLYRAVKDDGVYRITQSQIQDWLSTNKTYTMHKAVKKVKKRTKVKVAGVDDQFDADLAILDTEVLVKANDGFKFLLVMIDVFSRYLWVKPLKDKSAENVIRAFDDIFKKSKRIPRRLRTDRGSEFTAGETRKFFARKGVHQIFTSNELQANYAERVIKTIKGKIKHFGESVGHGRYIDELPNMIESYNNTFHEGILAKPKDVKAENEKQHWWRINWPNETFEEETKRLNAKKFFKYKAGDFVRITLTKDRFTRAYSAKWTGEVFIVKSRFLREGSVDLYKVTDYEGEELKGTFYRNELQKITGNPVDWFIVDEILGERHGGNEVKVSYKYWPTKFNRWIKKELLEKRNITSS